MIERSDRIDTPIAAATHSGTMRGQQPLQIARRLVRKVQADRATTLAAAAAYHTIFALPALVLLVVMAAAVVNRATDIAVTENLRDLIANHAPASTQTLLNEQVDTAIANVGAGGLSVGILITAVVALWSGSNAVGSLLESFNLAYDVPETRSFLRRKGMTLGLTLLLAVSINLAFALLVFGRRIGEWLADQFSAGRLFDLVWNIGRWPVAVAALALILSLLYSVGPNTAAPLRLVSIGSIFAVLMWLIATAGFGLFLRFSNPGSAYGVVGSVLVLLFYLYVTTLIFILGAELNALLAGRSRSSTDTSSVAPPAPGQVVPD